MSSTQGRRGLNAVATPHFRVSRVPPRRMNFGRSRSRAVGIVRRVGSRRFRVGVRRGCRRPSTRLAHGRAPTDHMAAPISWGVAAAWWLILPTRPPSRSCDGVVVSRESRGGGGEGERSLAAAHVLARMCRLLIKARRPALLLVVLLLAMVGDASSGVPDAPSLALSQYIEGSSYNKAIQVRALEPASAATPADCGALDGTATLVVSSPAWERTAR
eukprot:scaffold1885_cov402-Prasinococcus_capsulatus_cf.AAC.17